MKNRAIIGVARLKREEFTENYCRCILAAVSPIKTFKATGLFMILMEIKVRYLGLSF